MKHEKRMQEMLAIFQDGVLKSLKYLKQDLNFKLECAFLADKINKNHTSVYGVFKKCEDFYFQPWDEEYNLITDLKEIAEMNPELLNTEVLEDGYLKIYCNCTHGYSGGNIFIKMKDILLYDEDFNNLTLDDLNHIIDKYWYSSNKAEG